MKKLLLSLLLAVSALGCYAGGEDVMREHRAIWFSPMLKSTWPGGRITESGAASSRRQLTTYLTRLQSHGINTLYFHVRAHCDATYESSFEPWSSAVGGSRGTAPGIDPFGTFIEVAHSLGIEVYAWVNPYRYSSGGSYGEGERNYENSHPEWLMSAPDQKILNPGLPEVRQRVVDVCSEVATKYDIDGLIFDDYFYHSSIGLSLDRDLWQAYKDAGGTLSQADWRRENVNMMVRDVRDAVKAARPYAVFSISPAGRISPDNIASYGLTPGPYGDMNYSDLYADPIYWLSQGWLDFLSPQVYWHSYFNKLTDWYSVAVPHFNRHLYTSVDCSRLSGNASEYIRQIEYMRSHVRPNESGVVFFDYGAYTNYREVYHGKNTRFGEILRAETFAWNALSPIHHWRTDAVDRQVGPVVRSGNTLSWTAPEGAGADSRRYALYLLPEGADRASFACQPEYLVQAVYGESYEIPSDAEAGTYAVAVYDRFSNLHGARFEGSSTLTPGVAPTGLSAGATTALGRLSWTHAGAARYQVEISADASFSTLLGVGETFADEILVADVADLSAGTEYFWRVKAYAADHTMAVSGASTVAVEAFTVTAPTAGANDLSTTPSISWTNAGAGASYTLEIADAEDFTSVAYSVTTEATTLTVPAKTLSTGRRYWVRVTATIGNSSATARTVQCATADRSDYTAPAIVSPGADGVTLHADECVVIAPWEGMTNAYIEISASETFPTRSTFKQTLSGFATESKAMADVKISSKALVSGNTYYVRVRGGYSLQSASGVKYTDYGTPRSFVYSDQAGVIAPETDAEIRIDAAAVLHLPAPAPAAVYDLAGRTVYSAPAASSHVLSHLPAGVYIVRTNNTTLKWVK